MKHKDFAKIPIISSSISLSDLKQGWEFFSDDGSQSEFSFALHHLISSKYVFLMNSGIASFYFILQALREKSSKKEVILPAYTAGSLIVAVQKAGLIPVLCDISLEDFNIDREALSKAVSEHTLAVVLVHMFGIPMYDIKQLKDQYSGKAFVIEDCAQAMGSVVNGEQVGTFGDLSFFSLNRGKNLSTVSGGFIATHRDDIEESINIWFDRLIHQEGWKKVRYELWQAIKTMDKSVALSASLNPYVYGLLYSFLRRFKQMEPPKDFNVNKLSNFQAGLGIAQMRKAPQIFTQRNTNGMQFINGLSRVRGVTVPSIKDTVYPVFNRLPVLIDDPSKRRRVEKRLWRAGYESSVMYGQPLHKMFKLGYYLETFPQASFLAQRLLALPVHQRITSEDVSAMIHVIAEALNT